MGAAHGWRECIPVLLSTGGSNAKPVDPAALGMAWSLVPDQDRRLFHEFCCLNRDDAAHLAALERIRGLMALALGGAG